MNTLKITENEIAELKIASLPKRPTAPKAYGGCGYSAQEMKAAFDRLPLFIMSRLNSLIDDIESEGEGKISESIKTGMFDYQTLDDFFRDVKNGNLASYLAVADSNLAETLAGMQSDIQAIKSALGIS